MSAGFFSLTSILYLAAIGVDSRAERDLYDLAYRIANEENQ